MLLKWRYRPLYVHISTVGYSIGRRKMARLGDEVTSCGRPLQRKPYRPKSRASF